MAARRALPFCALLFALCVALTLSLLAQEPVPAAPVDAVNAVLEAFGRFPLVALAEAHALQEEHDFLHDLLRHPRFPRVVNDIVIEWGNARYQDVLDRYVAGDDVDVAALRPLWRDHTASPIGPWDAEVYEQFFRVVREVNAELPSALRLRVLAADPPVDWNRGSAERIKLTQERDKHAAGVIENEILAKGRKGLVLVGGMHLARGLRPNPKVPIAPEFAKANITARIEARHKGSIYVIWPHTGLHGLAGAPDAERHNAEFADLMKDWPKPSIAALKGTRLGAFDAGLLVPAPVIVGVGKNVPLPPNPVSVKGKKFEDLADAVLYLGPLAELTASAVSEDNFSDKAYLETLSKRQGGRPFDLGRWRRQRVKYYQTAGSIDTLR
jgi:hypothetical protein